RVEVWDTGPGIPDDHQDRIFDEFHRVNASVNPADGMGLGLAIVERACRLLEHPLQLQSEIGRGTRFSVELKRSVEDTAPEPQDDQPAENAQANLLNSIVLLVENNEDLRAALTLNLENWGVSVLPCHDQAEAEELLAELDIAPDAIVADYQLDDGALGTDVIAQLRARLGPIPSCIITADRTTSLGELCKGVGAELIHKPIDPDLLLQFLEQAIGNGQSTQG
ncbi:MAG: response regulator, partial [Planctomycetales bacterium]|nr:response regulator [Planctomycetales bacterium]NIP67712.1 response regulator [Planctomycetales bacterium]